MKNLKSQLEGKKTYLVSAGFVVYAILGVALGQLTPEQALQLVLSGLGFATLRAGVAKA